MKIRQSITSFAVALVALGLGLGLGVRHVEAGTADADIFWVVFENTGPDFSANINIEIDDVADTATFTFTNESTGTASTSSIANIYWEEDLDQKLENPSIIGETGVDFQLGGTPAEPPGGNNMPNSAWTSTAFTVSALPPPSSEGINPGDELVVQFDLVVDPADNAGAAAALADLIAMILNEDMNFRMGAHVLECDTAGVGSCTVYAQPIPPAIWLFVSALMGMAGFGYRRRRKAAA